MARLKDTEINGNLVVTGDWLNSDGVNLAEAFTNPNLLINSDFRNPVNQRGATSYSGHWQNKIYTIDRWAFQGGSNQMNVVINDGYITLTSTSTDYQWFGQNIERALKSGLYTVTVKVKSLSCNCFIKLGGTDTNDLSVGLNTFSLNMANDFDYLMLILKSAGNVEIEYIKLEQGSIATPFVPRPYAEELVMCQRYYVNSEIDCFPGYGFINYLQTQAIISVPAPTKMRTVPTLKMNSVGSLYGMGISTDFTIGDVSDMHYFSNCIEFRVNNLSGYTKNQPVICAFQQGYSLDAEIY